MARTQNDDLRDYHPEIKNWKPESRPGFDGFNGVARKNDTANVPGKADKDDKPSGRAGLTK